ncbi:MAG: Ig-like domain-containing protein [Lachnospiraceae bacterium]|nr:Ig-like domain-containing protein [Lachnospiraceae bacterium]
MKRTELGRILAALLAAVMLLSQGVFAYAGTLTPYDDPQEVTESADDAADSDTTGIRNGEAGSEESTENASDSGEESSTENEIAASYGAESETDGDTDEISPDEDESKTGETDTPDTPDTPGDGLPEDITVEEDTDDDGDLSLEEKERIESSEDYQKYYAGHLPFPGEEEVPDVDPELTYRDMRNQLREHDEIIPDAAFAETLQKAEQRAYPEPYAKSDELKEYLEEHYPATRNQGDEGTCWAHAAIGTTEFYALKHNLFEGNPTLIDYSELHLAYWCYVKGTPSIAGDTGDKVDYKYTYSGYSNGILGVGGNAVFAVQTLMQKRGVAEERVAPYYNAYNVKRKGDLDSDTEREDTVYLRNAYKIGKKNRDLVKQVILENGAAGVSFYSYFESDEEWKSYDFENNGAYYCPYSNWGTNHEVVIVGWDDDYPKENFKSRKGKKYVKPSKDGAWLARNSWTTDTDVNDYSSYFWLSYEDKSIPGYWVFELNDLGDAEFDNSYFYDSQMHNYANTSAIKSANVYEVCGGDSKETLRAVSFDIDPGMKNVDYTVEIYTGVDKDEGPESGELREEATTKGTIAIGGTYTITLEQAVEMNEGDCFSVVVSLSNGKSVNYEGNFNYWKSHGVTASANAKEKQSYIKTSKGWSDFGKSKKKNLIIHALTVDGVEGGSLTLDKDGIEFKEYKGETAQLSATVTKKNGNDDDRYPMIYKSTDKNVAEVDENGLVTAVGNGEADIIARSNGRKDVCHVKVDIPVWTVEIDGAGGRFAGVDAKGNKIYEDSISMSFLNGESMILPNPPVRAHYDLIKWENREVPSTFYDTEGNLTIEGNMKIGAVWEMRDSVEDPVCEPDDGETVRPGDRIILRTETPNATIWYKLNDSDEALRYTGPIPVTKDMAGDLSIKARATRADYKDSAEETFTYTVYRDTDAEWGDILETADREQCGLDEDGAPLNIPEGIWIANASMQESVSYQGSAVTFPDLRVYLGNVLLVSGRDYTISYKNNKNVTAKASFTVKGKGGLDGQAGRTFSITQRNIADTNETDAMEIAYTGKAQKPAPEIRLGNYVLSGKKDYSITYYKGSVESFDEENPGEAVSGVKDAGDYVILLRGKGNFGGTKTVGLSVAEKTPISQAAITGFKSQIAFKTYADPDEEVKQTLYSEEAPDGLKLTFKSEVLEPDEDFEISYQNNDRPGTATMIIKGKGDYTGTVKKTFKVKGFPMNRAALQAGTFKSSIEWNPTLLTEGALNQEPELTYEGEELTEGVHYTLIFKNSKKPGKATVTAAGMGHFEGKWQKTYKITKCDIRKTDGKLRVYRVDGNGEWSGTGDQFNYNSYSKKATCSIGSEIFTPGGPRPSIALVWEENGEKIELKKGKDYTISYKNQKHYAGYEHRYTDIVIKGKGAYTQKATANFEWEQNSLRTGSSISVSDKARTTKAKGLYSTPVITDLKTGKKLKAGVNYDKNAKYEYEEDATLANGEVRHKGEPVKASDVLMEGTTAVIRVTVKGLPFKTTKIVWTWWGEPWPIYSYKHEHYLEGNENAISAVYEVREGVVNSATVTVNGGKAYAYTGAPIEPGKDTITVKVGNAVLADDDYEIVGYSSNVAPGTAKVILRGLGDYGGEKTATFKIAKKKMQFVTNDE